MVEDWQPIRDILTPSIVYPCRILQEKERQEIYRYRMRILNSQKWRPKKM